MPISALKSIPGSTYRLQCHREFDFARAAALAPYLKALGITHYYLSPPFKATAGSVHGYDVCGFEELNPELGGADGFRKLSKAARDHGLGLLVDMVPNHMGNDLSNQWWRDVLEHGPGSRYARWFDIDWRPRAGDLFDRVLLPVLEDHYFKVLESGKLQLHYIDGTFNVQYHDRGFPVSSACWACILEAVHLASEAAGSRELSQELPALIEAADDGCDPDWQLFAKLKEKFKAWHAASPALRSALTSTLKHLNGTPGDARSFDELHRLLSLQHYRLAFWRVGSEEINYRRFFDVTQLVSMRMELPDVFAATHKLPFELIGNHEVTGLRIDHPDGLRDPRQYFDLLQQTAASKGLDGLYVVAEKILSGEEALPDDWKVDGTTGYDFLARLNGLFVESSNAEAISQIYTDFAGPMPDFRTQVYEGKKRVLRLSLISELGALARRLKDVCLQTRYGQDFTLEQLRAALAEVIACFPVYRTYITQESVSTSAVDARHIRTAVADAKRRAPGVDPGLLDFIESVLLLRFPEDLLDRGEAREFVIRFQQLSGPATAKGLEDTSFYNYFRLISLNEVGGEPDKFGLSVEEFHRHCQERAARWPHSLLATATHDTKRGEDARVRISVISEMPDRWAKAVKNWAELARAWKTLAASGPAPDTNDEYLFYQTLAGAWSKEAFEGGTATGEFVDRVSQYMLKAIKESKRHTTWTEPNADYESATKSFVQQALASEEFIRSFRAFHEPIAWFGMLNSMSQVLIKAAAPGVPDFYQGSEFWDLSLVDPDNRRAVDYEKRTSRLAEIQSFYNKPGDAGEPPKQPLSNPGMDAAAGDLKLLVMWRVLQLRRAQPELFRHGSYEPLVVSGAKARHLVAFARRHGGDLAIFIAPRLCYGLLQGATRWPVGAETWGDTALTLPPNSGKFTDIFTGNECAPDQEGRLRVGRVLASFPLAVLQPASTAA